MVVKHHCMAITAPGLGDFKRAGHRFVMLTAYDYQTAQILDEAGVPVIFVGDTLGIFFAGRPTTVGVSMDTMVHHCLAVSAAVRNALVQGGVAGDHVKTISYGKERPFCTESNEQCWQQNRRGHFVYGNSELG